MLINYPTATRMFPICAICLVVFMLIGCVTETKRVDPAKQNMSQSEGLPLEVLRIPQQMQDLAGDLLRYHSRYRTLPVSLDKLVEEKIVTPERFAELPNYLYSPTDRYKLRDGRIVILVDSEVRIEGHAWCIVKELDANPNAIQLNVTPVPLVELDLASRNQ
jgi:hypothetical protein